jgi:hypothetical protein
VVGANRISWNRSVAGNETVRAWYQQRNGYKANIKMKAVVAVMRKLIRALWCMGRDAENTKAFDSRLLFDVRRLNHQGKPLRLPEDANESRSSSSAGNDRKRPGHSPPFRTHSTMEVNP